MLTLPFRFFTQICRIDNDKLMLSPVVDFADTSGGMNPCCRVAMRHVWREQTMTHDGVWTCGLKDPNGTGGPQDVIIGSTYTTDPGGSCHRPLAPLVCAAHRDVMP